MNKNSKEKLRDEVVVEDKKGNIIYPDNMINKANQLITGKYTTKMTVLAHKVFNYSLSVVKFDTTENRAIAEFTTEEISEFLGIKHNSIYSQMYKVARCLRKKEIIVEDRKNNSFYQMTLINIARYKDGKMTLKFEPECTDLVLNLKPSYTKLNKKFYKHMNNIYAIVLYENLLSKYFNIDTLVVTYEIYDLKLTLGMIQANDDMIHIMCKESTSSKDAVLKYTKKEDRAYEDGHIFKKALEKAINEINDITDIYVEYEFIKEGKGGKISKVKFTVMDKEKLKQIKVEPQDVRPQPKEIVPSDEEIFDLIIELKLSINELRPTQIRKLLECANYDKDKVLEKYKLAKQKGNVNDLMAWLVTAIKDDFKSPFNNNKVKPKNKFHDFSQREYTQEQLDELERKLLAK